MKYFLLLLLIPFCIISSQDFEIKSLKAYSSNDKISIPVVTPSSKLIIEFDVEAAHLPDFNIVFRFCNKNWEPTKNLFLLNTGKERAYFLDYSYLPTTVEEADYHFKASLPDKDGYVTFPFSGKWRYYITHPQDTSIVYADGKFYYVENQFDMSIKLRKEQLDDKYYFPVELSKVVWITAEFNLPEPLYPGFVDELEVVQNHLVNYPYVVDRNSFSRYRVFEWNADRKFLFSVRDVKPGNEYRQADLRDINLKIGDPVRAQRDGLEYSHFFLNQPEDLNGGFLLNDFKDSYSTYMDVDFSVKPPDDVFGDVYLVGSFNNWQLQPEYKMNFSNGIHSLTNPLKRGIYDYQYVVVQQSGNELISDWLVLEGNDWTTKNDYHLFLFYNDPEFGGYDRIISYKKISAK